MSWRETQLGEVAQVERSGVAPDEIRHGTTYVGLENIKPGGGFIDIAPVAAGQLASTKFKFSSAHILYGKLRPYLAKIEAPNFAGVCSTDILPVRPGPELDRRYLLQFLRQPSLVALADSRSSGANLPRLSPNELEKFAIPLPPLPEQRRIAAILDHADTLRSERRTAEITVEKMRHSVFNQLFGDLQRFPICPLSELAEVRSGLTKGRRIPPGAKTRLVPYMAVLNVQDRRLNLSQVKEIEATEPEIEKYRLRDGDLLLTEGGDPDKLGRGTVWRAELPESIHQNHIFNVRLHTDLVSPLVLNWITSGGYGKQYFLRSAKQTTGIASINATQLKAFPVPLVPVALQRDFLDKLAEIDRIADAAACSRNQLGALFFSLQSRAFRGDL